MRKKKKINAYSKNKSLLYSFEFFMFSINNKYWQGSEVVKWKEERKEEKKKTIIWKVLMEGWWPWPMGLWEWSLLLLLFYLCSWAVIWWAKCSVLVSFKLTWESPWVPRGTKLMKKLSNKILTRNLNCLVLSDLTVHMSVIWIITLVCKK